MGVAERIGNLYVIVPPIEVAEMGFSALRGGAEPRNEHGKR
jgi:hypothetical protein